MSAYSDAVVNDGATTYLRFGETSGTTADDAVGSDDHTYENSPTLGEPSLLAGDTANKAVYWDGTNDRTWCNSPTSALDIGDKFSIEFWVKRTRTSATEYIWSRNWSGCAAVYINSSDKVTLAKAGYGDIASATTSITDTNPHHIVVTKNGSTVKIYIDGSDVTGSVSNQTIGSVSGGSGHCWQILVGNYFKGTLDEFAVYKNVELTSTQIADHYDLGSSTGAVTGSAALSGSGTLAGAGTRTSLATAALSGSGTLATAGWLTVNVGAALRGWGRIDYHGDPPTTIGVCVHPGWTDKTYNDYTNCFADIDELGTKLLRGGGATDGNITQWLSRCYDRGAKMIYGSPDAISGITSGWLDTIESQMSSYPGVICAIEGLNEPDLNSYGEQQGGESSVEYALRHQKALYNAIKGRFPDLPILAPSIAGNSGWSEPLANRVADYCTVANCHYYTSGGTADVSLSAVNTAFANARDYAGATELWVTETGIRSPVTGCTDAEGATRLVGILDAMRHDADYPAFRVCVYQLESPDNVWADENDWALYYYGFTPKAKADALNDYIDAEAITGAALVGSGTFAATGNIGGTVTGAAALSGAGTLDAAGVRSALGEAALSGAGALDAAGTRTTLAGAALSGTGTLDAGGTRTTFAAATLSGTGTLDAAGTRTTLGAAALSGSGTLTSAGTRTTFGVAALTGSGTLTAASGATTGAAALSGSGTLDAAGVRAAVAAAALSGFGVLAAAGVRQTLATASLPGTGVLGADGWATVTAGAGLLGTGVLAAAGQLRGSLGYVALEVTELNAVALEVATVNEVTLSVSVVTDLALEAA